MRRMRRRKPVSEYPKGWQVVGENGPEIIDLKSTGSIMTVGEVREYMRNYGKSKDENDESDNA